MFQNDGYILCIIMYIQFFIVTHYTVFSCGIFFRRSPRIFFNKYNKKIDLLMSYLQILSLETLIAPPAIHTSNRRPTNYYHAR